MSGPCETLFFELPSDPVPTKAQVPDVLRCRNCLRPVGDLDECHYCQTSTGVKLEKD